MTTGDASELINRVITAHGGRDQSRPVRELVVEFDASGFLFVSKLARTDYSGSQARVFLDRQRTEFSGYPKKGLRGIFDRGSVHIESECGDVIARCDNPRPQFSQLRRRVHWDELDVLYFAGYAIWTYFATPFVFGDDRYQFATVELSPWRDGRGRILRRLAVTYPEDLHAHSARQVFYYDDEGLLRRNDYTAEIVGKWATTVHFTSDYREFAGGLSFPTRRRVYPRLPGGRALGKPLMIRLDVRDVEPVR